MGYARRNFLVPLPEVSSFDELNRLLLEACDKHSEKVLSGRTDKQTIAQRFAEEKPKLLSLPTRPFEGSKTRDLKVNKFQVVRIDRNYYSVPTSYTGHNLRAIMGCWKIQLYDGLKPVAEHDRSFERDRWVLGPLHYLKLLKQKPGAFDEARPILQWRSSWPAAYEALLSRQRLKYGTGKGTKEFLLVLLLLVEYSEEKVLIAIEEALEKAVLDNNSIKQLLLSKSSKGVRTAPLDFSLIPGVTDRQHSKTDISKYNLLLVEGVQ